jgi:hypothetical protein
MKKFKYFLLQKEPIDEREILIKLYDTCNGNNWKNNNNWNTFEPLNNWYGITTNNNGNIIKIDLNNNQLTNIIPECIGHLKMLEILNLQNNDLIDGIPSTLSKLKNLKTLKIDLCNLKFITTEMNNEYIKMSIIRWLENIQSFNLMQNAIDGGDSDFIRASIWYSLHPTNVTACILNKKTKN